MIAMSDCSKHAFDVIRSDHIVAGKVNLRIEHDRFGNRTAVVLDGVRYVRSKGHSENPEESWEWLNE